MFNEKRIAPLVKTLHTLSASAGPEGIEAAKASALISQGGAATRHRPPVELWVNSGLS